VWLSDNIGAYSGITFAVVGLVVMRIVQKAVTRIVLLGLLVTGAVFVYSNQPQLELCANTCACRLVHQDVTVPGCNTRFPGDS
jgi:hypothetical protein